MLPNPHAYNLHQFNFFLPFHCRHEKPSTFSFDSNSTALSPFFDGESILFPCSTSSLFSLSFSFFVSPPKKKNKDEIKKKKTNSTMRRKNFFLNKFFSLFQVCVTRHSVFSPFLFFLFFFFIFTSQL